MLRRQVIVALLVTILLPASVARLWAQERQQALALQPELLFALNGTNDAAVSSPATQPSTDAIGSLIRRDAERSRLGVLVPLYASTATFQALDVHSTLTALGNGAREANPVMSGVVSRRPLFIATKAAVAASTIYAAHRLAKHNKAAAIAVLVGINCAYGAVVAHNYRVARLQRQH